MHRDPEAAEDGQRPRRLGLHDSLGEVTGAARELFDRPRRLVAFVGLFLAVLLAAAAAAIGSSLVARTVPYYSHAVVDGWILLAPTAIAFTVAFGMHAVADRSDGDATGLRSVAGATLRRWRQLTLWGLLSVAPLVALAWIAIRIGELRVFDPAGTGDPALWFLFGAIYVWSVPTYFVVPVIAFERRGFLDGVRRGLALTRPNALAVAVVQASVAACLLLALVVLGMGGGLGFVGAGSLMFAFPLGVLLLFAALVVVALAVAIAGFALGILCSVRYRCYERVR